MIYWLYALQSRLVSALPHRLRGKIFAAIALGVLALAAAPVVSKWRQDVVTTKPLSAAVRQTQARLSRINTEKIPSFAATTGDLQEIKRRGNLRVLLLRQANSSAARSSSAENELISQYAAQQHLAVDWIYMDSAEKLLSSLQQGKGDIALSISATSKRSGQQQIQLTLPWGVSQQQVISRTDTGRIRNTEDLGTRQIAIKRSSPVWKQLQSLLKAKPSMDLLVIPELTTTESILQRVASAQYDVAVLDNLAAEPFLQQFLNLQVAFNLTDAKTISWAIRSSARKLHGSLNSFLNKQYLQSDIARSYKDDLPALQARKLLRLITYQSPVNYYLYRGKLKGFEYDLVKRFAELHQMRLDVVIADSHEEMQALLLAGKGDMVAASMPRQSFHNNAQLAFSRAYNHAAPVVIGRTIDTPIPDERALSGRRIVLPAASPYREILEKLKNRGIDLDVVVAAAGESQETILLRVAQGSYDLTVLGGDEIKSQLPRQVNLRAHFALTEPLPHVWAVRATDTQLLTALNEFIAKEFRNGFYNVLYSKYIERPVQMPVDTQLLAGSNKLSPYDDIVHKYAEHYGFDWRLIIAQMYQESQFDPNAVSYAGAEGLMQIIPETAESLGIADANDPDTSIQGGIRYMDYLRGKFDDDLLLEDRLWFSLAAYNAGYSRVQRARLLAEKMNLDKNKWFDNVEKAMQSLARPYWKNGEAMRRCRCGQTVIYVRDIKTLYNNYVHLTRVLKLNPRLSDLSQDM